MKSRSAPAPIAATMCATGRCWTRARKKRPVWLGAATEDRGVGVSKYTAAVTHHIGPDLDAERALLAADLENAGMVEAKYQVTGIGPTIAGHNGGGDLYYTDGEIWVLRLVEACKKARRARGDDPEPAGDRAEGSDLARDRQCGGEIDAHMLRRHSGMSAQRRRPRISRFRVRCCASPRNDGAALAMTASIAEYS